MEATAAQRVDSLIQQRRRLRQRGARKVWTNVEKQLQKELRAITRARRAARIGRILEEFKGLRFITGITNNHKKQLIGSMRNKLGELKSDRQSIADVFAEFYEDLYGLRGGCLDHRTKDYAGDEEVQEVTVDELRNSLKKMSKNKAADGNGVVVELLQEAGTIFLTMVAEVFNSVLKGATEVPNYRKETT